MTKIRETDINRRDSGRKGTSRKIEKKLKNKRKNKPYLNSGKKAGKTDKNGKTDKTIRTDKDINGIKTADSEKPVSSAKAAVSAKNSKAGRNTKTDRNKAAVQESLHAVQSAVQLLKAGAASKQPSEINRTASKKSAADKAATGRTPAGRMPVNKTAANKTSVKQMPAYNPPVNRLPADKPWADMPQLRMAESDNYPGKDGNSRGADYNRKYKTGNSQDSRIKDRTNYIPVTAGGSKVKMIALGGLEQIGMNITAFETEKSIVIIDCGMAFPDENMPGIDLVIPEISYLKQRMSKIEGIFITHGHEDHIGALPYVLKELDVPIFCTKLTRALIEIKLREHGLIETTKLNTVSFGDIVDAGEFHIEFIKTNHSIQDAAALAIHSPAGVLLHTGDFKVDYTPVFGDVIDLQRFAELGKNGVLALLADSTNAVRKGFTMSEKTVGHTFDTIFAEQSGRRIIVATFASNVDRVQQVITVAEKYGRKVAIDGRSMINIIGAAEELGYIRIQSGTLIDISEVKNYPDDKVVLIVTGSQGESMAVLARMASGQHKKLTLSENDVIIMSSTPIPGNEKAVSKVINELSRRKTKVIYQDTHVSGHACAEELKLIYSIVRPEYVIPVHGELRHRLAQRDIALEMGIPNENILLIDTGDVVSISEKACFVEGHAEAGPVMVDGLGVGDVGNVVLKDRQSLSQNGIIIISVTLERESGNIIAGPEIVTRGVVYVKENEGILKGAESAVYKAMERCAGHDANTVRNAIRSEVSDYVWRTMKRTPVVMPIVSEC